MPNSPKLLPLLWNCQTLLDRLARPQLRAIQVNLNEKTKEIFFWFFFDGEIAEDDERLIAISMEFVTKDLALDFPPPYVIQKCIRRWDYPKKIPDEGIYLYLRDETILPNHSPSQSTTPISHLPYFDNDARERQNLFLFSMYALLGKARPNLRLFLADVNTLKHIIYCWFYYDGMISDEDRKNARSISATVVSLFQSKYQLTYQCETSIERVDAPQDIIFGGMDSIYERDESLHKAKGKKTPNKDKINLWRDLITGQIMLYGKNAPSLESFSPAENISLLDTTRPSWRAIKYEIDQFQRRIYLQFYLDKKITKHDYELIDRFVQEASFSGYNIIRQVKQRRYPLPIPPSGRFLFLRDESMLGPPRTNTTPSGATKAALLKWTRSFVTDLWHYVAYNDEKYDLKLSAGAYLRDVKIDINHVEKKLYFVFFFHGEYTNEDIQKAKKVIRHITSRYSSKYTPKGYIARYDFPEKIPAIAESVYLRQAETQPLTKYQLEEAILGATVEALVGKIRPNLLGVSVIIDGVKKVFHFFFYYRSSPSDQDLATAQDLAKGDPLWPGYSCKVDVCQATFEELPTSFGFFIYLSASIIREETKKLNKVLKKIKAAA
jgi:hypothetical protein